MPYITHNNKRYEIVDNPPFIGCLMITEFGIVVQASSLPHMETLVDCGAKLLIEVPIYTEHTLSSILVNADKSLQDKRRKEILHKTKLARVNSDVREVISSRLKQA